MDPVSGPGVAQARRAAPWLAWLPLVPFAAAAAAILFVRAVLGFQFPVPWPDETGFVAPAFDLAHGGGFFDPGMNPDRVVMWMPPGYMVLLAGVFRVAGYSFGIARWFSALACLGVLAAAAWLTWRMTCGWRRVAASAAFGLAFLSPVMLMDANIARMDMLLAAMVMLALCCAAAGRPWIAAALVAAGMTVHFNAAYFGLALAVVFAWLWWQGALRRPGRLDALALAAAALALALYGVHILQNFSGFKADMAFQFDAKRFYGADDPAHPLWPSLAGAALALLAVLQARGLQSAGACALFGVTFLLMAHNGHELWYDYAQPLGFALIALSLLAGAARGWQWAPACVAMALTLVMAARITDAVRPLLPHRAMLHRSAVPPAEIAKVRAFIATLKPGDTVNFGWSGMEPFFFADLARTGARWTIIRHSVTQVWPLRPYDWRVRCDSSEWPAMLLRFDIDYPRNGRDTGCDIVRVKPAAALP